MRHRNEDPSFDADDVEENDPLGEDAFAAGGFSDAPDGGPAFSAPGMEEETTDHRPDRGGQKVAGVPQEAQHRTNTPSEQRPDSDAVVIRERGGQSKGDPAVGGTRPES